MEAKCKICGRIYEIEEKKLRAIRPSSYLCPLCRDKGGKVGTGLGATLLFIGGTVLKHIIKKK